MGVTIDKYELKVLVLKRVSHAGFNIYSVGYGFNI